MSLRERTASPNVFDGMVPVLMHTPPTASRRSQMPAVFPSFAAWIAARWPAGPVPRTNRSNFCNAGIVRGIVSRLCEDSNMRAVLFDMDGVLVFSEDAWFAVYNETLVRFGHAPIPRDAF